MAASPVLDETLRNALADLAGRHGSGDTLRAAVLVLLRDTLAEGRAEIRERLRDGGSGLDCVHAMAHLADRIVSTLADFTLQHVYPTAGPTTGEQLSLVAVGGYGRNELAPYSDLDLLFLLPYKRTPRVEQVVEYVLYMLWDLGLKVGHAVRSVDECLRQAKADITVRTTLLETRLLWGDGKLLADLRRRFDKEVVPGTALPFVEAKLAERDARHIRLGDSRYVLEPNVKDGKGGLRDLHTLFWIAKYLYRTDDVASLARHKVLTREEAKRFAKAHNFLTTTRCHLHDVAGRAEDRLTFDVQTEIARRLGYTDHAGTLGVERFMKHYFLIAKDVGDLTRIFCAALEADSRRTPRLAVRRFGLFRRELDGFELDGQRLSIRGESQFRDRPIDMIRLFHVAQANDLDIHPHALRALTRALSGVNQKLRADPEANRLFLEILTSRKDPEVALRRMSEAGVLGRFVPDFGRVMAQMQYDMYHAFTVDEHTLFALGILHRIESGELRDELPLATKLAQSLSSRRALYVALMLHDICKGRGGDHSILGAKVAEKLGPRLGLSAEETDTVVWLVRWHLAMSETAFKRDLEDDKTLDDFAALVRSPERLRLLLVLTTADIRAVGPGRWNNWKATLLAELYNRAEERLSGGFNVDSRDRRVQAAQAALAAELADWPAADRDAHLALAYPAYWLAFDPATHARHARLIREAAATQAPLTVATAVDPARAVTEVTIHTADHPGLFSQLAGAMALSGANILDAKIFTMTNGMALDIFTVQDATGGAFASTEKLKRLSTTIERTLSGAVRPHRELAQRRPTHSGRTRVLALRPRVLVDNEASSAHTVIEVNGRDRPGLLHDVTRALTDLGLQIASAKIATYGSNAIDVFYVKDIFGLKVGHDSKLAQIREKLLAVLADPAAEAANDAALPVRRPARREAAGS